MKITIFAGGWPAFMCPGCNAPHAIFSEAGSYDGNAASPTFSQDLQCSVQDVGASMIYCHSTVTAGQISFGSDSTHSLAGKTATIPDWPTS